MQCELVAMRCTTHQASLASNKVMNKFFSVQARQEAHHALIFEKAFSWMRPKHFQRLQYSSLNYFENKLQKSLSENNLGESIIAQQLLFEGLGEITLEKLSMAADVRGLGFQRIRNTILKQERAHHAYGEKYIDDVLNVQDSNIGTILVQCREYLELLHTTLHEMNFVLEYYGHNSESFYQSFLKQLPSRIREEL